MRIFITGSTGFLGSNLLQYLLPLKEELYLYRRGENPEEAIQKFKPDLIFHLAAELHNEDKMAETNVILTSKLLEASLEIPYRAFINIGTSSEYGRKSKPMKEDDLLEPFTLYGATKAQSTINCQNFAINNNKPVITLRPFSIYGPGESPGRLIPTAIECALKGKPLTLGKGGHDWIYVDDVVRAILHFASQPGIIGQVVNLGTGIQTENDEVVNIVSHTVGKKIEIKPIDRFREYDSDCWVADMGRAVSLGWWPSVSLREGIEKMVDYYKEKNNDTGKTSRQN